MAKYKVFSKEFDPMVASGPPTESDLDHGLFWTEEDTENMRKLEQEYTVEDTQPTNQWSMKLDEGEI